MIRVGFILSSTDNSWVGGLNYLSNLLYAIEKISDRQIEPVLIVPAATPASALQAFPPWEVLRTALVDGEQHGWSLARKLCERVFGRDIIIEQLLKKNHIDLLSHSGQLGRNASLPTIGWLADFQHVRMPEFFEPKEIAARDRGFFRISRQCTTVLLSSADAQQDLAKFDATSVPSSRVLHFVSGFSGKTDAISDECSLRDRYNIFGPYFHLPNQFWIHKNHRLVIDALAWLKENGQQILVVCTGHTKDRRWPDYFEELMRYADERNVADCFQVLGLVPYQDMTGLMKHAVGVINPSLFEGWSTTVEEAKSLGLTVLLSDIPVHREQNPERGIFFDPHAPVSLANACVCVIEAYRENVEVTYRELAREKVAKRFSDFGLRYQEIALETSKIIIKPNWYIAL